MYKKKMWLASVGLMIAVAFLSLGQGCSNGGTNSSEGGSEPSSEASTSADGGTSDSTVVADSTKPTGKTVERRWVYRMIAGISMGGGMSSIIGLRNHKKFDIIGTMGAPNDLTYLFHYIRRSMLGGFCDYKKIEEMAKQGKLNTKEAFCPKSAPPARYKFEFTSHYNNWHYDDAGGNWNRASIVRVLQDLVLGIGNSMYYNKNSHYWPHEKIPNNRRSVGNRCNTPIKISGVKHYLYNPEGKYDLITFCDGNGRERSGVYYPEKAKDHNQPVEFLLAVDFNGNGKRDYGEPVISMSRERFDDVGTDKCPNAREDGKGGCVPKGQKGADGKDPNGDDYEPLTNPRGTEGNTVYDDGEPYLDDGIDGVAGTKDYGEGDKKFTRTPGLLSLMAHDPWTLIRKMKKEEIDRLNIYIDGGIRDLFNFHISALHLLGAIRGHYPKQLSRAPKYDRFISLMPKGSKEFDFIEVDWSNKGQHMFIQYGDPNATAAQIEQGDGDHVNGGRALDRVLAFFSFVTNSIPDPDLKPVTVNLKKKEATAVHYIYQSKALGFKNIYSVVLPPGFYANPKLRYPVVYFGHGYGMDAPGMASLLAIVSTQMAQGYVAKMILVSLNGRCEGWSRKKGGPNSFTTVKKGDCLNGSFYVNVRGLTGNDRNFEDSIFEVIKEVETKFGDRIRKPETRTYKIPIP